MADPANPDSSSPAARPAAHDALGHLLDSLHQHGFLRVAHDFVDTNSHVAGMLSGLDQPVVQNGMQNLIVLLTALSRIPPEQLERTALAAGDAIRHVTSWQPAAHHDTAPGVAGAYRLLHDEALWQALMPLLEALKVFSEGLSRGRPVANGGANGT
ncbi:MULTISPECIES: hypothetical protein [Burkholderia]|uniref:DUF1641 domain-containing protein n=1 Tax=Burkholderia gladioli TaxID=28095 RepID=A0A2A7SBK3_BURGA|nr:MULTISPECIES: hypothetical protein [Burkholderia]ATF89011.1 hypothetical protein CO712_29005 [Burkholderia gladioli pv. gladioli]MBJ9661625.1 hypothetical protein [Burkholderia gladioli]MBJ9712561.1 hypothetical protein [Burkholderia gladioli]MBU9158929.1 hypothetical protein [Burkholderia gladioli]MBU9198295.1 hypothetical protein [Burkholderia gladioli]